MLPLFLDIKDIFTTTFVPATEVVGNDPKPAMGIGHQQIASIAITSRNPSATVELAKC
jgi:hypothetical protein